MSVDYVEIKTVKLAMHSQNTALFNQACNVTQGRITIKSSR